MSQEGNVWRSQPAQKKNECQRSGEDNKRGADERGALVERGATYLLSSRHVFQLLQESVRTQTTLSLNTWRIKHKFLSTPVPTICSSHKHQPWIWYVHPGSDLCLTNNTGHYSQWSHWRENLRRVTDTETLYPTLPYPTPPLPSQPHGRNTQRHKVKKTLPTCPSCGRAVHMLLNDRPTLGFAEWTETVTHAHMLTHSVLKEVLTPLRTTSPAFSAH